MVQAFLTVQLNRPEGVPQSVGDDFQSACKDGNLDAVAAILEASKSFPPSSPMSEKEEDEVPPTWQYQCISWWDDQLHHGLSTAVTEGHRPVVAHLLSNGVPMTVGAVTNCIRLGHTHIFEEFVNYGFDINSTDMLGEPVLR